ncbi:MAG TPA: GNAT family N-acetyltransferase [Bacteroidia bacterium]|nr:GNAT family N-acetyltransferase [Bacteroidia bacterium]HNT79173.1 GNAT family N-acetyltransferase [Bacteroidia bacterium]
MNLIHNENINRSRWDQCILESKNASIFSESIYLDSLNTNWKGLIHGDYKAVMPVPEQSKFGYSYLSQPIFSRYISIHSKEDIDPNPFYTTLFKTYRTFDIQVEQRPIEIPINTKISERHYQAISFKDRSIDLISTFSENHVRNIKKSKRLSHRTINGSLESVMNLFKSSAFNQIKELQSDHLNVLENLMKQLQQKQKAEFWEVVDLEGNVCAAACFIISGKCVTYLKGGSSDQGKKSGSMHLLMYDAIQYYKDKYDCFDFGGSSVKGVAQFFKGFGADDFVYLRLQNKSIKSILGITK